MLALFKDVRFALRMLVKRPGTTLVAIFTLALAIAANTSIFSAVNTLLLKPLPYPEPERMLVMLESAPDVERMAVPYPNYLDYKAENTTLSSLAAMGLSVATVTGKGDPEQVLMLMYSHDMLPLEGYTPLLGRNFLPEEDAPRGQKVALLKHSFWTRRYAADPAIVGKNVTINGSDWTVVGVLPPDYHTGFPADVFTPLGASADEATFTDRAARPEIYMFGRMKPGVTEAEVKADMLAIGEGLARRYPKEVGASRPLVLSLNEEFNQEHRGELTMLMAAVIFVLLIAAANVANLMLERAMTRQKEMGIRAALGAGRWRLVRQLLVESMVLALIGGGLGLLLALWGVDLVAAMRPQGSDSAIRGPIVIDATVLGYTLIVALGTGLLFGLVPALYASRHDLAQVLKEADHHASAGSKHLLVRNMLVVGEVAIALMLLISAGLAMRSLARVQQIDPGFDLDHLLMSAVTPTPAAESSPAMGMQFWDQVKHNMEAIPGVESVGWSSAAPFLTDQLDQFLPLGIERTPENMWSAVTYLVSPGFIETLKVPLLAGRTFGPQDVAGTPPGILIDKELADAFFPGQDPVGQRLQDRLSGLPSVEIIGVVGHVKQYGLDEPEKTPYQIYYAFAQLPEASQRQVRLIIMHMIVRVAGEPTDYHSQLRAAVTAANPLQPLFALSDYKGHGQTGLMNRRYTITLLGVFAGFALVLAVVGLYAVMGNTVAQRTHELGVRMALGAQPRDVVNLVVRQGMVLVGLGVAVGLVGAVALTQSMPSILSSEVGATDPPTFIGVTLALLVVGLVATYIPARRATRIDPMVALRHE